MRAVEGRWHHFEGASGWGKLQSLCPGHSAAGLFISSDEMCIVDSKNLVDNGLVFSHNSLPKICPALHYQVRKGVHLCSLLFISSWGEPRGDRLALLVACHS